MAEFQDALNHFTVAELKELMMAKNLRIKFSRKAELIQGLREAGIVGMPELPATPTRNLRTKTRLQSEVPSSPALALASPSSATSSSRRSGARRTPSITERKTMASRFTLKGLPNANLENVGQQQSPTRFDDDHPSEDFVSNGQSELHEEEELEEALEEALEEQKVEQKEKDKQEDKQEDDHRESEDHLEQFKSSPVIDTSFHLTLDDSSFLDCSETQVATVQPTPSSHVDQVVEQQIEQQIEEHTEHQPEEGSHEETSLQSHSAQYSSLPTASPSPSPSSSSVSSSSSLSSSSSSSSSCLLASPTSDSAKTLSLLASPSTAAVKQPFLARHSSIGSVLVVLSWLIIYAPLELANQGFLSSWATTPSFVSLLVQPLPLLFIRFFFVFFVAITLGQFTSWSTSRSHQ